MHLFINTYKYRINPVKKLKPTRARQLIKRKYLSQTPMGELNLAFNPSM